MTLNHNFGYFSGVGLALLVTFRVWVVWEYGALPCQISKNLNTRYND